MQSLSELEKLSVKVWDVFSKLSLSDSVYDLIVRKGDAVYRSLNYERNKKTDSLSGVLKAVKNVLPRNAIAEFGVAVNKKALSELLSELTCQKLWTVHYTDLNDVERFVTVFDCLDNSLVGIDVNMPDGVLDSVRITVMPFTTEVERKAVLLGYVRYTLADVDQVQGIYACDYSLEEVLGL